MNENPKNIIIFNESNQALIELFKNFDNNKEALDKLIEIIKEKGNLHETFFVPLQER